MQKDYQLGEVILIDKPYRWSSFDVVKKVRGLLNKWQAFVPTTETAPKFKIKVGHAGTLDPLATGLMLVCTGRQTKNIDQLQTHDKEYTGTFFLGATTLSFDLEQEIDQHFPTEHITEELIYETAKTFVGEQEQVPPIFSAIKVDGKRAYKIARKGKEAEIKSRQVNIYEFEITSIEFPKIHFRIFCSKGTYIRSLVRDFGLALNSGAYLEALRRTKVGSLSLNDAISLSDFEELIKPQVEIIAQTSTSSI